MIMKPRTVVFDPQSILPPEIRDRAVWYGTEVAWRGEWVERLSELEVREVESAVERLQESGRELATITAKDVTLPTLGPRLRGMLDEVMNGRGFVLIKS